MLPRDEVVRRKCVPLSIMVRVKKSYPIRGAPWQMIRGNSLLRRCISLVIYSDLYPSNGNGQPWLSLALKFINLSLTTWPSSSLLSNFLFAGIASLNQTLIELNRSDHTSWKKTGHDRFTRCSSRWYSIYYWRPMVIHSANVVISIQWRHEQKLELYRDP